MAFTPNPQPFNSSQTSNNAAAPLLLALQTCYGCLHFLCCGEGDICSPGCSTNPSSNSDNASEFLRCLRLRKVRVLRHPKILKLFQMQCKIAQNIYLSTLPFAPLARVVSKLSPPIDTEWTEGSPSSLSRAGSSCKINAGFCMSPSLAGSV